jgi:MoaA/NifB/PqqE/SkfB family radical SAM enzyme
VPIPITDCAPGHYFLFVDEQGFVGPCSFTTREYGVALRDLRSPDDLARLPNLFGERQRRRRPAACANCPSTQVFGKFDDGASVPITLNDDQSRSSRLDHVAHSP